MGFMGRLLRMQPSLEPEPFCQGLQERVNHYLAERLARSLSELALPFESSTRLSLELIHD